MKTFNSLKVEYNIRDENGELLLSHWVDRNRIYDLFREYYNKPCYRVVHRVADGG